MLKPYDGYWASYSNRAGEEGVDVAHAIKENYYPWQDKNSVA